MLHSTYRQKTFLSISEHAYSLPYTVHYINFSCATQDILSLFTSIIDRKKEARRFTLYGFNYACKRKPPASGKRRDDHPQWGEDVIDSAVEEVIRKFVSNSQYEQVLLERISRFSRTAAISNIYRTASPLAVLRDKNTVLSMKGDFP